MPVDASTKLAAQTKKALILLDVSSGAELKRIALRGCDGAGQLSASNDAGDLDVFYSAKFNTSVVRRVDFALDTPTDSVVADVKRWRGMDGHLSAIYVSKKTLVVHYDQVSFCTLVK